MARTLACAGGEPETLRTKNVKEHIMKSDPFSPKTYRDLATKGIVDAVYKSMGGSPWAQDFEDALDAFIRNFDVLVDAVPEVSEVLDSPLPTTTFAQAAPPSTPLPPFPKDDHHRACEAARRAFADGRVTLTFLDDDGAEVAWDPTAPLPPFPGPR
jgi:hypothetical protein